MTEARRVYAELAKMADAIGLIVLASAMGWSAMRWWRACAISAMGIDPDNFTIASIVLLRNCVLTADHQKPRDNNNTPGLYRYEV